MARDVAVIAFAQLPSVRRDTEREEVELVQPVVKGALEQAGLTIQQIGFTVSGSADFLLGRPFSFVSALDGIGPWPPISESHVEMDGAWALYEAWVHLQCGEVDTALVYAYGKSSLGSLRDVLVQQLDPYYVAPLGPDSVSLAALQARALLDTGSCTERDLAEIAVRNRKSALGNEYAQVAGAFDVAALLREPYLVAPLRKHACPPISDGACAVVLAAGDRARALCKRPAWIRGIDHRADPHALGARDLTDSPSIRLAASKAGLDPKTVDFAELHAPFAHQEIIVRRALGLGESMPVNPSGGALAANPVMVAGLTRIGEAAARLSRGEGRRAVAHATSGPCLQQNLVCVLENHLMNPCAIIGIGQTQHRAKREDVSIPGLLREAAKRALEDAALSWKDIDAIVIGTAPDMFEGIMMPELFLADALGAAGKPISRVHTAGSVGGSTALVASHLVHAGVHERVLTLAFEKQSESDAMWALSPRIPFQPQLVAGAGGYFAPLIRAYMRRSGAPAHIGHLVAVKDRQNGLKNPFAHLRIKGISREMVEASPMLWDPIRYLDTCPSSDGAVAMVLTSESAAKRAPRRPAWIHAGAMRSEPVMFAGRDQVNPRAGQDCAKALYAQAGITNPRKELDGAEIYVPFSWFEPMWLENLGFCEEGQGWKLTEAGVTALGGELPVNASGGVLCTNPIGASGMLRFAEAAMQVRGDAGEHQIDGARRMLGHAYGGGSQFFAMWIVGSEKP